MLVGYKFEGEIQELRMRCSRAVFARKLRINERTLEKWEQGRAKPNPQAAALVLLVRRYPDTLERLEKVAAGLRSSGKY
jgi:DNA-binding transcriptional regulator YiaG